MSAIAFAMTFELARIAAMLDSDRTRVELPALDDTYVFYCKTGPAGEAPRQQAELALAAFRANLITFADTITTQLERDVSEQRSGFATGYSILSKSGAWSEAITQHLEQTYGCMWVN